MAQAPPIDGRTAGRVPPHDLEAEQSVLGAILLSDQIPIERYSTPAGLRVRLDEIGVQLMVRAVRAIREEKVEFRPQTGEGCTYTRPTLRQEIVGAKVVVVGTEARIRLARSPSPALGVLSVRLNSSAKEPPVGFADPRSTR